MATSITYGNAVNRLLTPDGELTPVGVHAMQLYNAYSDAGLPPMAAAQLVGGQLVEDRNLNPLQIQGPATPFQSSATVSDLLNAFSEATPGTSGIGISQWTYPPRQAWVQNYLADNFDPNSNAFAASAQTTVAELNSPAYSNVLNKLQAVNPIIDS